MRATLVVLGFVLASCAPDGGGAPIGLRPGVVVVHKAPRTTRYSEVIVTDVERVGDRLVMLVITEESVGGDAFSGPLINGVPEYFVSDDFGATWTEHEIAFATPDDYYPMHAWPDGGLLAHEGEIYEIAPYFVERALEDHPVLRIYHVDLERNVRRYVGTIEAHYYSYDGVAISGVFGPNWISWDPATATEIERRMVPFEPGGYGPSCSSQYFDEGPFVAPARRLRQTCVLDGPRDPAQWCRISIAPPIDYVASYTCYEESEWPVAPSDVYRVVHGPDGMLVTTGLVDGPHETSLAVLDAAGARLVSIGPGEVQARFADDVNELALERERYAGLVALVEHADEDRVTTTLYRRAGAERFEASPLPTRPCPDGSPCGYRPYNHAGAHIDSLLQWAEPVPGGMLMIYVVDEGLPSSGISRNVIYASLEPNIVEGPPPVSNELAVACARATSCFPAADFNVFLCLEHFSRLDREDHHDEFLAATDCDTIRALLPEYVREPCTGTESQCVGNVATFCDGGYLGRHDCTPLGTICEVVDGFAACPSPPMPCTTYTCLPDGNIDACGTTFDCVSEGAECVSDPSRGTHCVPLEPACLGPGRICLGNVVVGCESEGHGRPFQDCARLPGQECVGGGCAAIEPTLTCNPPRCEGTRLVFCDWQVEIEVDCADLGLSCVIGADGALGRCE